MQPNFYQQATADLGSAAIAPEALAQMITRYTQQNPGQAAPETNEDEIAALLAAIAQNQRTVNGRYIVYPFKLTVPVGFDGMTMQILPSNPNRKFLAVQYVSSTTCTLSFNDGPVNPQGLKTSDLVQLLTTGLDLAALGQQGGQLVQLNTAPNNPVTLIVGDGAGAQANGIFIEIAK